MNVAQLSPRIAQVTHALICVTRDQNMPATAPEVCVYDEQSPSVSSTYNALLRASWYGMVVRAGHPAVWTPTFAALDLRIDLEDRVLAEWDRVSGHRGEAGR